jgi:hypothetical protein
MLNKVEGQLQELEISLEDAQDRVNMAEALQRLHENKDFRKVILDGYFAKESQRVVMARADVNFHSEENLKQNLDAITGIGQLGAYFHKTFVFGESAYRAIEADKETKAEILAEQLDDGPELGLVN